MNDDRWLPSHTFLTFLKGLGCKVEDDPSDSNKVSIIHPLTSRVVTVRSGGRLPPEYMSAIVRRLGFVG